MSAVSEDGRITGTQVRQVAELMNGYSYFETGDVLVAKITPCFENGKAAVAEDLPEAVGFGSTEFHVLRPGPEIDRRYLFYAIWNPMFRRSGTSNMTGSAGQKRVPADFVRRFRIPLPPLPDQHRIAAILDKADDLRRKREESIRLMDELLRSTFLEMFGDPVRNPKGWARASLEEIANVDGGLQVTASRSSNPIGVPYLRVANVFRDRLDLSEVKKIRVTSAELERCRLRGGDVLIVEGHGNPAEIGRSAVWSGEIDPCVHQNHLMRVRFDRELAHPAFISAFLNSLGGRRQLLRSGKTTSGLNTISTSNVKAVRVPLPPVDLQHRYAIAVEGVEAARRRRAGSLSESNRLFRALLDLAFRGEL